LRGPACRKRHDPRSPDRTCGLPPRRRDGRARRLAGGSAAIARGRALPARPVRSIADPGRDHLTKERPMLANSKRYAHPSVLLISLAWLLAWVPTVAARAPLLDESRGLLTLAPMLEKVTPAVVNISVTARV